jgi:hypothetical protein
MERHHLILAVALAVPMAIGAARPVAGEAPAAPTNVQASDHKFDDGTEVTVSWELSQDDQPLTQAQEESGQKKAVSHYNVLRSSEANGLFTAVARVQTEPYTYDPSKMRQLLFGQKPRMLSTVIAGCERDKEYWFRVEAVGPDGDKSALVPAATSATATRQWFDGNRFWMMIITVILCGAVIYWIIHARRGKPVRVRKIAGLEAVDEAVGRATEMGRSVLFVPGIQDMNDIQTIAGITVLARVAKTAAEYDAKIEVPTSRALVMTAARETVQASFLSAGRPDLYNEDLIYYVTDEQFGYVAYLQGMMVREKPAACFYMGSFFAESLILAETGNSIGAIQIAGTAQPAQLPFFVAACDYTLIGEEFFAASAYLSGSPEEIGSLKGQDVGKVVVAFGLLVGVLFATLAVLTHSSNIEAIAEYIRDRVMA